MARWRTITVFPCRYGPEGGDGQSVHRSRCRRDAAHRTDGDADIPAGTGGMMSDDDISAHRPIPADRRDGPSPRRAPVAPWERRPPLPQAESEDPDVNVGPYSGQMPRVPQISHPSAPPQQPRPGQRIPPPPQQQPRPQRPPLPPQRPGPVQHPGQRQYPPGPLAPHSRARCRPVQGRDSPVHYP